MKKEVVPSAIVFEDRRTAGTYDVYITRDGKRFASDVTSSKSFSSSCRKAYDAAKAHEKSLVSA